MKMFRLTLPTIVAGVLVAFASHASAGGSDSCCSRSCCDDGVTASPKVRAMLDERCMSRCVTPAAPIVNTTAVPQTYVAGTPKVQQMQRDRTPATMAVVSTETAGYRPTGSDGITASPKLRAQLDERRQVIELAPLK